MRRHGLQLPLDPHQLASWIIFFALVSGVYAFYVPFVEDAGTKWFLVALYTLLVVGITTLDLYTSYLDPSDPGLTGATDGEFFCGLCQASVARNSKHCRACDRCVEGFDHHCKWLNNCVGTRNYWHFFALISSTNSLLVLQFAWGLWLFIRSFTEKDLMKLLVAEKYGSSVAYGGWQAALCIYMALLITAVVMLGELFFFHVVLISKGMTTYDYIVAQRDAKLSGLPMGGNSGGGQLKACRSTKVADTATARPKVKVGLNPCAAIRTSKPKGSPAQWEANKAAGKPGSGRLGSNVSGGAGSANSMPAPDKPGLEASANGSLAAKGGLGMSEKGLPTASVHDLVARAVAEGMGPSAALREPALLAAGPHTPAGSRRSVPAHGCVPECTHTPSSGGAPPPGSFGAAVVAGNTGSPDFFNMAGPGPGSHGSPGMVGSPGGYGMAGSPGWGHGGAGGGGGGGNFDAAMPAAAGRHLGGHAAGGGGGGAGSGPQQQLASPPVAGRPGALPPLRAGSGGIRPGATPTQRSLLFPSPSKREGGSGRRADMPVTPE
ncbi:hypothetical protein HYH03_004264 [Edaphochlamys debaryana]|uniref:S-acyltransferase n=1 Tax=Edaphochlamys debaryana TaxID=47281 RepID=A0A835YBX6_9CHLO|nr:hypothetical protein HYH03_004264 [Edaphochlamys debaryana]|eukprot:KAG2498006.1 hypothetical protein HYH03_004264 [Edaphochlamys debaryana]